ncbi:MAG: DMT family transporter [Alphaproteobacteria bacterium]|nr:DMT family transporter [Alphaproteobacteria bacterium]
MAVRSRSVQAHRPLLGIALMVAYTALANGLDAFTKWMCEWYAPPQLIWIRYTSQTILFLALMPYLGVRRVAGTQIPLIQLGRGLALLASSMLFVMSLSLLPFATANVLTFVSPLLVAALSAFALGENIGLARASTILAGFAGVVVVIRPGFGSIEPAMIFPLLCAVTYAGYQVLTRYTAGIDAALPSLFYTSLVGCLAPSLVVPFFWAATPSPLEAGLLFVHGILAGLGHFMLIKALSYAPASTIAPFGYASLLWSVAFGFMIFGETPDWGTVLGGLILALAGVRLVRLEARAATRR